MLCLSVLLCAVSSSLIRAVPNDPRRACVRFTASPKLDVARARDVMIVIAVNDDSAVAPLIFTATQQSSFEF